MQPREGPGNAAGLCSLKLCRRDSEIWIRDRSIQTARALVIAPHPDDEAIGMGGRIRDYASKGLKVVVVYITDGSGAPIKGVSRRQVREIRVREAKRGLEILGANAAVFLNYRSENLRKDTAPLVQDLRSIVKACRPLEVFSPSPFETHRTHVISTKAAIEALRGCRMDIRLYGYEVWTPIVAQALPYDVTGSVSAKQQAILAHKSQVRLNSFHEGMLGKNRYNAAFFDARKFRQWKYVELFIDMTELLSDGRLSMRSFVLRKFAQLTERLAFGAQ